MSLLNFLDRSAVVLRGGRRFVCRPPSCETVLTFAALYHAEIDAVEQATTRAGPGEFSEILPIFLDDRLRAGRVLRTCVTLHGAPPGDLEAVVMEDQDLAEVLTLAILGLCDVGTILARYRASAIPAPGATPDADDPVAERALVDLARAFHLDPRAILAWPYEMYLDVKAAVDRAPRPAAQPPGAGAVPPGMIPGVVLHDARRGN